MVISHITGSNFQLWLHDTLQHAPFSLWLPDTLHYVSVDGYFVNTGTISLEISVSKTKLFSIDPYK
jgi:hypothetical protein